MGFRTSGRTVARRSLRLVSTLLAVSILTFLLTSLLPGDPALTILGQNGATRQSIAAVHKQLGLDKPLVSQYGAWLGHALQGNLGHSYATNESVGSEISARLPVTGELIVFALLIALIIAVPLGTFTAYRSKGITDRAASLITFVMLAIPTFVVAVLLILVFGVQTHLFPASGWVALSDSPGQNIRSAFLPSLSLALPLIAVFSRLLRGDMLTTLDQDFIQFAESKGLPGRRIVLGHALRPSSFSLVTVAGLQVGFLMGGTVVVETLFNLPGVGQLLVNGIYAHDLITVQGVTLFIAVAFVVINFAVDVLYTVIDPRIRRSHGAVTA